MTLTYNDGRCQDSPEYNEKYLQGEIGTLFLRLMGTVTKSHLHLLEVFQLLCNVLVEGTVSFWYVCNGHQLCHYSFLMVLRFFVDYDDLQDQKAVHV